jgi:hypothetical protein
MHRRARRSAQPLGRMSTHYVPSSQEFRAGAESHFSFLCRHFDFKVEALPASEHNEFSVRFSGKSLFVVVEGFSYGYALGTRICNAVRSADQAEEVDLHTILKLRRPDMLTTRYPEERGQLEEMKFHASALREAAGDLLTGNLGEWPRLVAFEQAERLRLRVEGQAEWRRRDLDRACTRAAEAFRSGEYGTVIKLLGPHESELSTGQLMKLRMAKKRNGDAT